MYSITLGFTLQRIIVVEKNTEDFTFALMLIIHIGKGQFPLVIVYKLWMVSLLSTEDNRNGIILVCCPLKIT